MPIYKYKAKDAKGEMKQGTLSAVDEQEAESLLKDKKLNLLALTPEKKSFSLGHQSLPINEKINMCRYMALVISSGMSLSEGMDLLAEGSRHKLTKQILQDVSGMIRHGKSLYESFSKYQSIFGESFLVIIKTGETAGTLAESLDFLGRQYQQRKELRQKVMGALLYPLIIVALMIAVGIIVFMFVLPRLATVFERMDIDMPFFTEMLFAASLFLQSHMLLVFGLLAGVLGLIVLILVSKSGKHAISKVLLKMPYIKNIIIDYNLVSFTQSLSSLLQSSVAVTEAVALSTYSLSFVSTKKLVDDFNKKLNKGVSLSQAFSESGLFPPLFLQLVSIGEKTGNLEETLSDLASFYEDEVENSLKNFITVLEPTLMVAVGIGVGIMVISVISPIYGLIGQLQAGL